MDHFLLPRERLMELLAAAGRTPRTEGGGFLSTTDKTHGVVYPQLYQVLEGIDYSRFDRFHVNRCLTETGVDEVMHVLCGRGVMSCANRSRIAASSVWRSIARPVKVGL